jgi:hypothetical protein
MKVALVALRLDHPRRRPPELAHLSADVADFQPVRVPVDVPVGDRRHPEDASRVVRIGTAQQPKKVVIDDLLLETVGVLLPERDRRFLEGACDPQQRRHDGARAGAVTDRAGVVELRPRARPHPDRVATKDHRAKPTNALCGRPEDSAIFTLRLAGRDARAPTAGTSAATTSA